MLPIIMSLGLLLASAGALQCPTAGAHRRGISPLYGVDSENLSLVRKTLQQQPVLEQLGKALREEGSHQFRWLVPVEKQEEADAMAKEIFLKYIEPFRKYGCTEENVIGWDTEPGEDSPDNCARHVIISNGFESWEESTPHVQRKNKTFHERAGRYISPWTVARHELQHTREIDTTRDRSQCTKEDRYGDEILTTVQDILDTSEIYQRIDGTADNSRKTIHVGHKQILLKDFAAFYSALKVKYGTLAKAITSAESIAFLSLRPDESALAARCPPAFSKISQQAALIAQYNENYDTAKTIESLIRLLDGGISCAALDKVEIDDWTFYASAIVKALEMGFSEQHLITLSENALKLMESHSEILSILLQDQRVLPEEVTEIYLIDLARRHLAQKAAAFETWMGSECTATLQVEEGQEKLKKLFEAGISAQMLSFLPDSLLPVYLHYAEKIIQWIQKGGSFATLAILPDDYLFFLLYAPKEALQLLELGGPGLLLFDHSSQETLLKHQELFRPLIKEGKINPQEITSTFLKNIDYAAYRHQEDNLIHCLRNGIIPIKGLLDRIGPELAFNMITHLNQTEFLAQEGFLTPVQVEKAVRDDVWNQEIQNLNCGLTKRLLEHREFFTIPLDLTTLLKLQGSGLFGRPPLEVIVELLEAGEIDGAEWVAEAQISGVWDLNLPPSVRKAYYGAPRDENKPSLNREFPLLSEGTQTLLGVKTSQPNDYETLGISQDATPQEIREAYKTTMRRCHPDKNKDTPHAQEASTRINEAWEALRPS